MLTAIVFSKDRPLQLCATLESLFHHCGEIDTRVLYRSSSGISYQGAIEQFPNVHWIEENGFAASFRSELRSAERYTLLLCDDVFFVRSPDLLVGIQALVEDQRLFGVSLRLGRNISPTAECVQFGPLLSWNWTVTQAQHWNYPWDVSASLYRTSDILGYLSCIEPPENPNFLEAEIAILCGRKKLGIERPLLVSFPLSCTITVTVNRVQETHPNEFDARKPTSPSDLYQAFCSGAKVDWRRFEGVLPSTIHVGSDYFELVESVKKSDSPSPPIVVRSLPRVSTVCFVYNRERFIKETIDSVLGQDYPETELIVLNDGSTDGTDAIVRSYSHDKRLKYVVQENIGRNLDKFDELNNRALAHTTGEYLCFVGADDLFVPRKTKRQLEEFARFPDARIVFSDAGHIDADGRPLKGSFRSEEALQCNEMNMLRLLLRRNFIPHPTVMMKRTHLEEVGPFETPFACDYDYWFRSAQRYPGCLRFVDEELVKYRLHDFSSSSGSNKDRSQTEARTVVERFYRSTPFERFFPDLYHYSDQLEHPEAEARSYLGFVLVDGHNLLQLAFEEFRKAYAIDPKSVSVCNNFAVSLAAVGNVGAAIELLCTIVPNPPPPHPVKGTPAHNLLVMRTAASSADAKLSLVKSKWPVL